jgi:hypothetical protein
VGQVVFRDDGADGGLVHDNFFFSLWRLHLRADWRVTLKKLDFRQVKLKRHYDLLGKIYRVQAKRGY